MERKRWFFYLKERKESVADLALKKRNNVAKNE